MSQTPVIEEVRSAVGILTIDRRASLNALNGEVLEALEAGLTRMEENAAVRAIVFTGAGDRAFVAGGDIAELNARRGLSHYVTFAEQIHRVFRRIETCDKPTIAAINGWALGGGTELVLCTDLRFAAEGAKFGLPEITLGLFPGAGGSQRLIRQLPLCRAKELMFMGDPITAAEALTLGLINRVLPKEELLPFSLAYAERLALKSPLVLKLLKRTLRSGAEMPLGAALAHEQAMIGLVLDTGDAHEGTSAFLEKRQAVFRGQ